MEQNQERSKTPKKHVRRAKDLANKIDQLEGVEKAQIDDWGRESNFQMAVRLPAETKSTPHNVETLYDLDVDLRSLRPQIEKLFESTDFYFDDYYGGFVSPDTKSYEVYPGEYESGHRDRYIMIHFRHPPG